MSSRLPGFPGEYLWEFDIARAQLLALAEAAPEEMYAWRPAEDARTFAAVLVHVAASSLGLLRAAGRPAEPDADIYGPLEGDRLAKFSAMVRKNRELEVSVTEKQAIIGLLTKALDAVKTAMESATAEDLDRRVFFFGERTTARRVYFRILVHLHEHMGQAVAYARFNGVQAPWPDPLKQLAAAR